MRLHPETLSLENMLNYLQIKWCLKFASKNHPSKKKNEWVVNNEVGLAETKLGHELIIVGAGWWLWHLGIISTILSNYVYAWDFLEGEGEGEEEEEGRRGRRKERRIS